MFQCETPRDRMTVHAMWKVEACGQAKSGWKCANQQYPACPDSRANFKAVAPYLFLFFTLAPETNSDHLMTIYMQYLHLPDYFLLHQKNPTNGPACFRKAKHILFRTVACLQQELHEFLMSSFRCSKQSSRAWRRWEGSVLGTDQQFCCLDIFSSPKKQANPGPRILPDLQQLYQPTNQWNMEAKEATTSLMNPTWPVLHRMAFLVVFKGLVQSLHCELLGLKHSSKGFGIAGCWTGPNSDHELQNRSNFWHTLLFIVICFSYSLNR